MLPDLLARATECPKLVLSNESSSNASSHVKEQHQSGQTWDHGLHL